MALDAASIAASAHFSTIEVHRECSTDRPSLDDVVCHQQMHNSCEKFMRSIQGSFNADLFSGKQQPLTDHLQVLENEQPLAEKSWGTLASTDHFLDLVCPGA